MTAQAIATPVRTLRSMVDEILQRIDDADGAVDDTIDALQLSIEGKTEAYAAVYRQLTAEAEAFSELARMYNLRKATREDQAEALRVRLQTEMARLGTEKIKAPTVTAFIKRSQAVSVTDETLLADRFVVTTTRADKRAIKSALETGEVVHGAELVQSESLVFR